MQVAFRVREVRKKRSIDLYKMLKLENESWNINGNENIVKDKLEENRNFDGFGVIVMRY